MCKAGAIPSQIPRCVSFVYSLQVFAEHLPEIKYALAQKDRM